MEKSYEKVIEYVKHGIGSREIQAGEKLLPERELAQKLEISRNSARGDSGSWKTWEFWRASKVRETMSPEILTRFWRRCCRSCIF